MTKWICNECKSIGQVCKCEITKSVPFYCVIHKVKEADWRIDNTDLNTATMESIETRTELPKLTAEIFDRPDCPEWANYAAVDKKGYVFVFDLEPECSHSSWYKITRLGSRYELCNGYDSSDYEHSLVRRSEQKPEETTLPDWCNAGAWVCCKNDFTSRVEYFQIAKTNGNVVTSQNGEQYFFTTLTQARLRPYNAKEMKALVGKVITHLPTEDVSFVTGFCNGTKKIYSGTNCFNAETLLKDFTINNAPCGVLEHLENGEWKA